VVHGRPSVAPNFSPVDAWQPDVARFARVRALDCVVEPGECLFTTPRCREPAGQDVA
jgi:hypothetical protein